MTGPVLRHFVREVSGRPARYHLRVDADGGGVLLANASAAVQLSRTGTFIAAALLEGAKAGEVAARVTGHFVGVDLVRARADVTRVAEVVEAMAERSAAYPILALEGGTTGRRTLSAPLTAEVDAPEAGRVAEMLTRLWEDGIPQVIFVLPDGRPARHLVALVERAEDLGMIAGVRARAHELSARGIVHDLAMAGVDHVDVHWAGPDDAMHDGIFDAGDARLVREVVTACHEREVCPVAVVPLLDDSIDRLDEIGPALAALRVPALVAWAVIESVSEGRALDAALLPQAALTLEEVAEKHDLNLMWAPPVERDPHVPLLDDVRAGPRTSGETAIRVRSDGSVLAPRGASESVGNLLVDEWPAIGARLSAGRAPVGARCAVCPGLELCASGCPASRDAWAIAGGRAS